MTEEKWGFGNAKNEKAFDTVKVGNDTVELFHGEHPHQRQDNSIYARMKNGNITGFDGHRRPLKIEIEEYNYLKSSGLSGDQIRKGCKVKIFCDGVQIFDEFHRNYEHAYRIAHQFIIDMEMNWGWYPKEAEKEVGKTVIYKDQLFKIKQFIISQSCLILETLDGKPRKKFFNEHNDDFDKESEIKVELLSPYLNMYPS